MSNMLFLKPVQGRVLEMHPRSSVAYCYENMAIRAGIPYRKLIVDDSSGQSMPNINEVAILVQQLLSEF
jgi:hypothetical protein